MGRIRTVKPSLFTHGELFDAEAESRLPLRLAFIALFTCCDREGRFKWRPRELKLACLPHDDLDFSRVLDALATRGFIVRYASQNGEEYGCIPTFAKHQVINNREQASDIPSPTETWIVTREARVGHATVTRGARGLRGREGNGREEEGKEIDAQAHPPVNPIDDFKARCAEVVKSDPERLPTGMRAAFLAYWTEPSKSGKLRFECEKFFDVGRRMDTWRRNEEKRAERFTPPPPSPTVKPWIG